MSRVLLAGNGLWVTRLEEAIRSEPDMSVSSRCADLADLLALAAAGLGDVAILGGDLGGLDLESVSSLRRTLTTVVAVAASPDAREWLTRLGVDRAVPPFTEPGSWGELFSGLPGDQVGAPPGGSCVAVWGPPGGPGATTVAISLALASAASGTSTLLVDLDPDGASIAQLLGLSGSGVERACRGAQAGTLTPAALEALISTTSDGMKVLTGVVRPDQWVRLRRSSIESVLQLARRAYDRVVCDVGSDIYDLADDAASPRPSTATIAGIDAADHLVLVGSADSVGLARLLRGVDRLVGGCARARRADVVVNQWRATLGWSQRELVGLLDEVAPRVETYVLPMDVESVDAASRCGGSSWPCRGTPGLEGAGSLSTALRDMTAGILGIECTSEPSRRPSLRH